MLKLLCCCFDDDEKISEGSPVENQLSKETSKVEEVAIQLSEPLDILNIEDDYFVV